jgi:hypothetical protein
VKDDEISKACSTKGEEGYIYDIGWNATRKANTMWVQWLLQVMFPSACSFIVFWFSLSFTTCFGLHGHLQVCRIFHIFIFICLKDSASLLFLFIAFFHVVILDGMGWNGMDWIDLVQDRDLLRTPVNVVINIRFAYNVGKLLSRCTTGSFSERTQLHEVS